MDSVMIVGATRLAGTAAMAMIEHNRDRFFVDTIIDDGDQPAQLASIILQIPPFQLGLLDEYAVRPYEDEKHDLATDAGILDWELPSIDPVTDAEAIDLVASSDADLAVVDAVSSWEQVCQALANSSVRAIVISRQAVDQGLGQLTGDPRIHVCDSSNHLTSIVQRALGGLD